MCNRKTTTHTKGLIMIPSTKKYLLIFSLILSSVQTTHSFWWLFFSPTTEERVQNLKNFCRANNVPHSDINKLARRGRSVYPDNAYHGVDHDIVITKTIIVDYYTEQVALTIDTVKRQDYINLSPRNRETVMNAYRKEFLDNLSAGQSISHLVGDALVASLDQLIYNAEAGKILFPDVPQQPTYNNRYSSPHYNQPLQADMAPAYTQTTHQPAPRQPAPAYTSNYSGTERPFQAKLHRQYLEEELKKLNEQNNNAMRQVDFNINSLSDHDSEQLKDFTENSTISMENVSADDRLFHIKFALEQFVDTRLEDIKKELEPTLTVAAQQQLRDSLEATRQQKIAVIKNFKKVDLNTIAELLGDNRYTDFYGNEVRSNNIKSTVRDNMGMR